MYRAITLYFLRNRIDWSRKSDVRKALEEIHLDFVYDKHTGRTDIYMNEENAEPLIRDMLVGEKVSEIAAIKEVRMFAVALQQSMGKQKGIVMDGRDIGTTVFPGAELKIFMTADPMIRVERRFQELNEKNISVTLEEVKTNLQMRDYIDSNRKESPLRKAKDAIVLDNTNLSTTQQLNMALKWAAEKINS
jgi:cytidylate kinase